MNRTIAEARQALDDLAPTVNQAIYSRLEAEIRAAEADATARATRYVEDLRSEAEGVGRQAVMDVCELRDQTDALLGDLKAARLSAGEAVKLFDSLRAQRRTVVAQAARTRSTNDTVAQITADPIGWFDRTFNTAYPLLRPAFTF
ncbi:MAG: hypothetical protein ACK5OX_08780 [Desertimonas sp.]